jgi:formylglycine-generating enzyme
MSAIRSSSVAALFWVSMASGCRDAPASPAPTAAVPGEAVPGDAAPPPWQAASKAPTPPRGMVWVPEGALIAGTPVGRLPRLADQEMAGQQLVLHGFFIDQFAYPNEEGAIPRTGVTREQAEVLCAEQNKRLCTELEWERACKGPENSTYEYGDRYRPDVCLTGRSPRMLPSGYRQGCRSEFGARDLHGGVWEWTASRWGRGADTALAALRGGNAEAGEVVGRCANASPRAPNGASPTVGLRCCRGEINDAVVSLSIDRGKPLDQRGGVDRLVAQKLEASLPDGVQSALGQLAPWRASALWDWRPINNARLLVGGGCAGSPPAARCGVMLAELVGGQAQFMAWVWSGIWPPILRVYSDPRTLWVYGSDRTSPLRQALLFESGRVRLGELQRKLTEQGEWRAAASGMKR